MIDTAHTPAKRNGLAFGVIMFAALMGVSVLVVEPLTTGRSEAMAGFERIKRLAAESGEYAAKMPALTAERFGVKHALEDFARRGAVAKDLAGLTSSLQSIASKHSVELERTQPRDLTPSVPPPKSEGAIRPDAAVSISIDAVGTYSGLSAFMRDIQRETGLTRVMSVRFTPDAPDADRVRASIVTGHFSFPKDAPPDTATKTAEVSP